MKPETRLLRWRRLAVQRFKKRNTGTKRYKILTKIRESEDAPSFPLTVVQQRLKGGIQGW